MVHTGSCSKYQMNYLGKLEHLMYRFAKMAFLVNSCLRLIHNLVFCIFLEFAVYYFLQVVLNFNLKKRQFIKSCIPGSVFDQQAVESYFVKKRKSFRGTQKGVLLTYKKQLEVHEKRKCRFRTFERCRHYYFLS